jgi:hypothetical protein
MKYMVEERVNIAQADNLYGDPDTNEGELLSFRPFITSKDRSGYRSVHWPSKTKRRHTFEPRAARALR